LYVSYLHPCVDGAQQGLFLKYNYQKDLVFCNCTDCVQLCSPKRQKIALYTRQKHWEKQASSIPPAKCPGSPLIQPQGKKLFRNTHRDKLASLQIDPLPIPLHEVLPVSSDHGQNQQTADHQSENDSGEAFRMPTAPNYTQVIDPALQAPAPNIEQDPVADLDMDM
jgi:hypothetical protein